MAKKQKQPHQPSRAAMFETHAANPSATKSGPGRYHSGGKAGNRLTKARPTRAYVALGAAWAQKRVTKAALRDGHGAYTLTGATYEMQAAPGETIEPSSREHVFGGSFGNGGHTDYTARRKWLAGISAQRGY
jgi:hypothetical protein